MKNVQVFSLDLRSKAETESERLDVEGALERVQDICGHYAGLGYTNEHVVEHTWWGNDCTVRIVDPDTGEEIAKVWTVEYQVWN